MKAPTNTDIMTELVRIGDRVEQTHNLAVKTNGRVTELERKWERREGYEQRIKEEQRTAIAAVKVETSTWDWKTVLAIILTLATAIVGIAGVTAK